MSRKAEADFPYKCDYHQPAPEPPAKRSRQDPPPGEDDHTTTGEHRFHPIVPNRSPLSKHLNGHRAFRTTEVLRSGFPKNWNLYLAGGCLRIPDVSFKVRQLVEQIRLSLKMFRTIRCCKQLDVNLATFQNLFEKLCTMGPSHQKT